MTNENIETALTPIGQAQRMLAEARTLPELKQLRDYATGAKAWAKARGMGIGAENEATEVIVRAEREIGRNLISLTSEGKFGKSAVTSTRWRRGGMTTGPMEPAEGEFYTIASLGLRENDSMNFQRLAAIEDERFEAMIAAVRAIPDGRLSKANFYSAIDKAERVRSGGAESLPTPTNPGMMAFLSARNHLLGWEVGEDGIAGPTKNGLLLLPDDDLRAIAEGLKALALAYTEARSAR